MLQKIRYVYAFVALLRKYLCYNCRRKGHIAKCCRAPMEKISPEERANLIREEKEEEDFVVCLLSLFCLIL